MQLKAVYNTKTKNCAEESLNGYSDNKRLLHDRSTKEIYFITITKSNNHKVIIILTI